MIPKFRAWDKKYKMMMRVNQIDFEEKTVWLEADNGDHENRHTLTREFKDIILMQSTGLKDKNGVEIYDGDIVRYTWDMPSDVNATEKGKKVRISKVFWLDWRASWVVGKKSCNNDLFRCVTNGNTVEVIGNVWQNPNLLEEE